ncbi:hypothetical protein PHISCL_01162 [Aspergillus sclerotialis]|uniref:Uncharacterized protein n=1 Tax=Aspergillus sclerotialis TaxID=2070753 RepID=A0A3A2ZTR1_9EURO|nr:hypothetical protein PHISCL_01162 [Aspergillus sclerotialis]
MLYNALIRTHHITSRKKVSTLKRAANAHNCFVILRSGGCPGIMYVEGQQQDDVESWVGVVRGLRYKDFQLVTRPQPLSDESGGELRAQKGEQSGSKKKKKAKEEPQDEVGLAEVETVKEFGSIMEQRGVWNWWRRAMGYAPE